VPNSSTTNVFKRVKRRPKSIGDYIKNFYNVQRRHSYLGYLNPIELELRSTIQQHVA
jgi:transposase InsO family protein